MSWAIIAAHATFSALEAEYAKRGRAREDTPQRKRQGWGHHDFAVRDIYRQCAAVIEYAEGVYDGVHTGRANPPTLVEEIASELKLDRFDANEPCGGCGKPRLWHANGTGIAKNPTTGTLHRPICVEFKRGRQT